MLYFLQSLFSGTRREKQMEKDVLTQAQALAVPSRTSSSPLPEAKSLRLRYLDWTQSISMSSTCQKILLVKQTAVPGPLSPQCQPPSQAPVPLHSQRLSYYFLPQPG